MKLIEGKRVERTEVVYEGVLSHPPHEHRTIIAVYFSDGSSIGLDLDDVHNGTRASVTYIANMEAA